MTPTKRDDNQHDVADLHRQTHAAQALMKHFEHTPCVLSIGAGLSNHGVRILMLYVNTKAVLGYTSLPFCWWGYVVELVFVDVSRAKTPARAKRKVSVEADGASATVLAELQKFVALLDRGGEVADAPGRDR